MDTEKGAIELIKDLLADETADYSFFENPKIEVDDIEDSTARIWVEFENTKRDVHFKITDIKENPGADCGFSGKIYVQMHEDVYELVETFNWTIKHFWMALLSWE